MPRTKETPGFADAMKNIGDAFKSARTIKDTGGNREQQPIDDGSYVANLTTARSGVDKNGNAYAAFDFEVSRGEFEGVSLSKFHSISATDWRTVEQSLESLFVDLQRLSGEGDFSELEPTDIGELVAELDKEKPSMGVGVKNWKSEKSEGINVYINKRVDADDIAGADSEEDIIPEDGDVVMWTAPRTKNEAEFVVGTVDEDEETCTLSRVKDGKTYPDVPWGHLGELVDDGNPF